MKDLESQFYALKAEIAQRKVEIALLQEGLAVREKQCAALVDAMLADEAERKRQAREKWGIEP
jgi:peptidoglycan hydrolase CwlO-like protein